MRKFFVALMAIFVLPAAALAQQGKPIVAIYQMDDIARSGQADTFSRMLETAITTTNKFRVIERERLGKLVGEQARANSGLVTTNRPGRIGGFEGADFLIYGSITTVSVTRKNDAGAAFVANLFNGNNTSRNTSCSNAVATVGIDIKITDADTGEVRYANRVDETQKSGASCSGDAQVDASLLLRAAAERIAGALVMTIYPMQLAAVQSDGTLVINYGQGSVMVGQTMGVFTKGESIKDPATGEVIGNDERLLGLIQVTDVQARFSKAAAVSPFASAPPTGSIVRLATANDLAQFKKAKRR